MKLYLPMVIIALLLSACNQPSTKVESNSIQKSTQVDEKTQLYNRLDAYFEASNNLNADKMLDMIYYKVYILTPRDTLKKKFVQAFNSPMVPKVLSSTYNKNIQIKNYSKGQYAHITWDAEMEMSTNTTDSKKEEFLLDMMKSMMKNTTITLDKKQHKLHLSSKKQPMLAIKENGRKWEFLDEKMSKAFNILPKDIK